MLNFPVILVAAILATGAAASGCGGGSSYDGVVSCAVSESAGDGILLQICEEVTGYTAAQAQQVEQGCSQTLGLADAGVSANETSAFAPCSRTHALGGCKIVAGTQTVTEWYYDDGSGLQTSANIQTLCSGIGATFVAP
jgi:hypothetical protein